MSWSVCKCRDTSQVQEMISNQQSISSFAHHTIDILETRHFLNSSSSKLIRDFVVNIIGEIVLEKFDPFKQCATQGEYIGLRRLDIEVGFRDRSFRDGFQQHPLQRYLRLFLRFRWHCDSFDMYIILILSFQKQMRPIEVRLVGRFRFSSRIQGQHTHLLYKGVHTQTSELLFMKGEEYKLRSNDQYLTILQEGKILQIMQGGTGIPHMHWCGQEEDYNFIVLQQLDRSLDTLQQHCDGRFTPKTVFMLGQEIIAILQYFHFKNFVHNQLKPANIMLGPGQKQGKFFLVDFGAASRYKDGQTYEHIAENSNKSEPRSINLQFSSLRYNRGETVSRRDDLESLIYLMLYWMKGSLPWSEAARNPKKNQFEKSRLVLKIKQQISEQQLFEGYPQLLMLFRYTRNLGFDEKPRYVYYNTVMKQKIQQLGYLDDKIYDWMLLEEPEVQDTLELNFEVVPNEAEFIRQIGEELKLREKIQEDRAKLKESKGQTASTTNLRSLKNKDKECLIY